jgi:hypothetical protein
MATRDERIASLLDWYHRASADIHDEGLHWYDNQRELIRELARAHNLGVACVAAVVAALSPMTRWTENVAGAVRLLRAWENGEPSPPRNATLFYKNAVKAWAILNGDDPARLFATSPKVYAFWCNLIGDETQVTIDRWMLRAMCEHRDAQNGLKPARYHIFADDVREAAASVGETPAEFQAIVWVQIRRELSRYDTEREAA